jgi:thymidylate synthase
LWNSIVHELLWFLSGENHIRNLKQHTKIWDAWADENGDLQTAYGWYWTAFPFIGKGKMVDFQNIQGNDKWTVNESELYKLNYAQDYKGNFNQIERCIEELKTNPMSRRMVVTAWEPMNAWNSKLPPCHYTFVFNVQNNRLCLHWTQRSCDCVLGLGFNIASYALLCHMVAQEVGIEPGILVGSLVDAHIYTADAEDKTPILANPQTSKYVPRCEFDHVCVAKEQLERKPYPLSQIEIAKKPFDKITFEDIKLLNYKSHERLKARVAV